MDLSIFASLVAKTSSSGSCAAGMTVSHSFRSMNIGASKRHSCYSGAMRRMGRLDQESHGVDDRRYPVRREVSRFLVIKPVAGRIPLRDLLPFVIDRRRIPAFRLMEDSGVETAGVEFGGTH